MPVSALGFSTIRQKSPWESLMTQSTSPTSAVPSGRTEPYLRLAELLMGHRIACALHLSVKHGIADVIGNGAKTAEELSMRTGIPSESLRRARSFRQ